MNGNDVSSMVLIQSFFITYQADKPAASAISLNMAA